MRVTSMRLASPRTILLVAMSLCGASTLKAQEPYFPDAVFYPRNKDQNAIEVDMTSVHLKAMKEPSLWTLSQRDRKATVYRFLWRATGQHPICLRLTRTGRTFTLHVAGHDGPPGLTAGRMNLDKEIKLSNEQGKRLVARIEKTAFWTAPVEVKESRGIADGDGITIEGVKDGRYHIVDRAGSTAGESYKAFCRSLLELADEPATLKAWDRFRESERESPRYRPEPPETEDLGDPEPDEVCHEIDTLPLIKAMMGRRNRITTVNGIRRGSQIG